MKRVVKRFAADRDGAVTADFIVPPPPPPPPPLAGAVVALGLVTANAIRSGTFEAITDVVEQMEQSGCVTTDNSGFTDLSLCN